MSWIAPFCKMEILYEYRTIKHAHSYETYIKLETQHYSNEGKFWIQIVYKVKLWAIKYGHYMSDLKRLADPSCLNNACNTLYLNSTLI